MSPGEILVFTFCIKHKTIILIAIAFENDVTIHYQVVQTMESS